MIHPCDGQTDGQTDNRTYGRAIAYTRYSIYAVARKKMTSFYAGNKTLAYILQQQLIEYNNTKTI